MAREYNLPIGQTWGVCLTDQSLDQGMLGPCLTAKRGYVLYSRYGVDPTQSMWPENKEGLYC